MKSNTIGAPRGRVLALATLVVLLAVASCSKSSSPTNPYGGGGGTGGGGTPGSQFNLGPFGIGQSMQFTFANTGTFGYHCIPHQTMGMTGTVQVDANGTDSAVVTIGPSNSLSFSPASVHVKPGTHVRWQNASGFTIHTVTSNN
jgi:plastocyanin